MIKYKNLVVTREELTEAKKLHSDSYDEYVKRRRKMYDEQETTGLVNTIVFATKIMKLSKPRTMKQCVAEVTNKTTGDTNGI